MDEVARLKATIQVFAERDEVRKEREDLVRREETNRAMREVLHTQRLAFVSSLSMVSQVLVRCNTLVVVFRGTG
jgi:hypothetical protein